MNRVRFRPWGGARVVSIISAIFRVSTLRRVQDLSLRFGSSQTDTVFCPGVEAAGFFRLTDVYLCCFAASRRSLLGTLVVTITG